MEYGTSQMHWKWTRSENIDTIFLVSLLSSFYTDAYKVKIRKQQ